MDKNIKTFVYGEGNTVELTMLFTYDDILNIDSILMCANEELKRYLKDKFIYDTDKDCPVLNLKEKGLIC